MSARDDYPTLARLRIPRPGRASIGGNEERALEELRAAFAEIDRLRPIVAAAEWWYGTMGEEPTNTEAAEALRVAIALSHRSIGVTS